MLFSLLAELKFQIYWSYMKVYNRLGDTLFEIRTIVGFVELVEKDWLQPGHALHAGERRPPRGR